ncbi:MAG: type II secretion system secretin GspD [Endozoicomonadaceae bacterium]|nr:type II secretion system secretin GspD [Endozoicomonadaceae bacterium]
MKTQIFKKRNCINLLTCASLLFCVFSDSYAKTAENVLTEDTVSAIQKNNVSPEKIASGQNVSNTLKTVTDTEAKPLAVADSRTLQSSNNNQPEVIRPGEKPVKQDQTQLRRWSINQQNTDLRQFIAQVATITGDTFILDPKLKGVGNINIISSKPMTKDEIYEIFLQVLNTNSFAVVPKGEGIKNIVTHASAKVAGADFSKDKPSDATVVTQVLGFSNIKAIEAVPILRPLISPAGHVAASSTVNSLVISDLKDNVDRCVTTAQKLDSINDNDYEVIPLKHAWVNEIVRIIQETSGNSRLSLSQDFQIIADERGNRLILKGNERKCAKVRKLVETLDQEGVHRSSTRVVFLHHADAKNLATILTEASQKLPQQASQPAHGANRLPGTNSATSSSKLADNVYIKADETTNSLVMIADHNTLKDLEMLIKQLDVRRAQILIEAAVVEVSGDLSESLGLQWGIDGRKTSIGNQARSGTITPGTTPNSGVTGSFLGNNNISLGSIALRNANFGVLINALTTTTNANLLSTPSLLTLDNEEAELSIGQEVPFKTGSYATNNSGSGGNNPFTTTERKPVGLTLKVTPHVGDSNTMRLEIEQEISKLIPNSVNTLGTSDVVTDKRRLKATVIADNTQTIVMAGLLQDDVKTVYSKVPFLGNIPVLGKLLFRNKSDTREKKNLMLFIRPTIMRNASSVENITRDKYNSLRVIRSIQSKLPTTVDELFQPKTTANM